MSGAITDLAACRDFPPQTSNIRPTFLNGGVQLCDLDGQPVNPILEGVGTQIEGVGFIEQLAKYILCVFTWKRMAERVQKWTF